MKITKIFIIVLSVLTFVSFRAISEHYITTQFESTPPSYRFIYNTTTKKAKILKLRMANGKPVYADLIMNGKICCESVKAAKDYYLILMKGNEKQEYIDNSWIEINNKDVYTFSTGIHKEWGSYKKYDM